MSDVFTGERIEPTPTHDGKLGEGYSATFESGYTVVRGGSCDFAELNPQQALSLLAWLTQEKSVLEQLAKEQAEPGETSIDFAEHLPPADWKQVKEQA